MRSGRPISSSLPAWGEVYKMPRATDMALALSNVEARYENTIVAVRNVTLAVAVGEIVALLGANGAGKTTTLRAISNLLMAERGRITRGSVTYDGTSTARLSAADLVQRGLVQVLEGRHCFPHLTVEQNLLTGALLHRRKGRDVRTELDRIYTFFPKLKEKRTLPAGLTSGGEQQMTAIGRALMAQPRLIVLDEPSMGLAPMIARDIFEFLKILNEKEGLSILVAEQNSTLALRYAHHAYVLETGRVVLEGEAAILRDRDDVKHFYLGVGDARRTSAREWRKQRVDSWLN